MIFKRVTRVPPGGGDPQEMIELRDASIRLAPSTAMPDGSAVFSVWCQAEGSGQIGISMGAASTEREVGTDWRRVSLAAAAGGEVVITSDPDTSVYLCMAQLEAGGMVSEWKRAPEDTQDDIDSARDAASGAQNTADSAQETLERVIRIDDDGTHFGDNKSETEVLVSSDAVSIVKNGQPFSRFAGNYVQFGDYQMRRNSTGGLTFKAARKAAN